MYALKYFLSYGVFILDITSLMCAMNYIPLVFELPKVLPKPYFNYSMKPAF